MMGSSRATLVLLVGAVCLNYAEADVNVYGQPLQGCGPKQPNGCTYSPQDAGAHEVCATKLPHGFSAATGQGGWSNQFTGQPWCICIWAYSNYILSHSDLPINCHAIPAKVLDEKYSLDKFKQCGKMSSKNGCGPEDIRRSIHRICDQCGHTNGISAAAKASVDSKCSALLSAAGAASPAPPSADAVVAEAEFVEH